MRARPGGDLADFTDNVKSLRVDLGRLDFVVLTHRHGDHTSGLHQVLKVNPNVRIYAPVEQSQFDTPTVPGQLKMIQRRVDSAPDDMHYYNGNHPPRIASGSPWPGAKFTQIREPTEVLPGFWVISTVSDVAGTREMNEISMGFKTPQGLVLMVGCSHPGIEKILEAAAKIDPHIYTVFGGFHLSLLRTPRSPTWWVASKTNGSSSALQRATARENSHFPSSIACLVRSSTTL